MSRPGIVRKLDHVVLMAVGLLAVALFASACNDAGGPAAPATPPSPLVSGATAGSEVLPFLGIDIEKATNGEDADTPPGVALTVGDAVTWTYVVTNTGLNPLADVSVTDDILGAITCPATDLAPNTSMTCTATGFATAGQYANVGTAIGFGDVNNVTDSDPSHYFGTPPPPGDLGCSQGYWGAHLASWPPTGYSPGQSVSDVFAAAGAYAAGTSTLQEALAFGGGPGLEGAARNLLRQAVGSLLNAAHPDVPFPRTVAEVVAAVDGALASGDRRTMLSLKDDLDFDNNLGCPLD